MCVPGVCVHAYVHVNAFYARVCSDGGQRNMEHCETEVE